MGKRKGKNGKQTPQQRAASRMRSAAAKRPDGKATGRGTDGKASRERAADEQTTEGGLGNT